MLSSHGHLLLLKYLSYDLYEVMFADLHGPCDVASAGRGGAPCGAFHRRVLEASGKFLLNSILIFYIMNQPYHLCFCILLLRFRIILVLGFCFLDMSFEE